MSRILITGGSGDLGRPVSALASRTNEVLSTYFSNPTMRGDASQMLDLVNRTSTLNLIKHFEPDTIIHTAMSDRSTPEHLITAAHNLIEAAQEVKARLVVMSTDMVFDGTKPPYSESDPPAPVSAYGSAKAAMETSFLEGYADCIVVRTSLIYDFDISNRQLGWMVTKLAENQPISLFTDEMRNPVYVWNLAEALLELASNNLQGILHFAGATPLSRYEYGCYLLKTAGYNPASVVEAVEAAKVAPQRPRDLSLNLSLAQSSLRTPLLTIEQAYAKSKR